MCLDAIKLLFVGIIVGGGRYSVVVFKQANRTGVGGFFLVVFRSLHFHNVQDQRIISIKSYHYNIMNELTICPKGNQLTIQSWNQFNNVLNCPNLYTQMVKEYIYLNTCWFGIINSKLGHKYYIQRIQMGQQMCSGGDRQAQFAIKGKSKTGFKRAQTKTQQKYTQSLLPTNHNNYVQQKKKLLEPYKIKGHYQRGKKYGPFLVTGSGVVYEGQWINGQPHGIGQLFFHDGSYYYGTFDQGFVHGQGRFISSSKLYYQGQVRHNVAEGKGFCVNDALTYSYNGDWMNDLPNGKGRQEWGDGTKYEGDFTNGSKNGKGILKFGIDGSTYTGYFKENEFEGQGQLSLPQGTYIGNFRNGRMQGKGVFKFKNGAVYDGQYKNNKKHGAGKYYKDGKTFQGKWQNGYRNGEGFLLNDIGKSSKGYWLKGQGYYI